MFFCKKMIEITALSLSFKPLTASVARKKRAIEDLEKNIKALGKSFPISLNQSVTIQCQQL